MSTRTHSYGRKTLENYDNNYKQGYGAYLPGRTYGGEVQEDDDEDWYNLNENESEDYEEEEDDDAESEDESKKETET